MKKLDSLFNPKSVAVVGVSNESSKIGSVIFNNILASGFKENLFPVNPKYDEVYGHKCYSSVSKIKEDIDIVIICIPKDFVLDTIKDCAKKKVKNIVIITAGFGETGEEGKLIENEILKIAKENSINILGPNCLGLITTKNKMNASFAAANAPQGDIAFASQSGALVTLILDMAIESDLGFSHLVSIGNKSDLNELDFIEHWNNDPEVKVIAAYLEDIANGDQFYKLMKKVDKPVLVLTPGRTTEAQQAISSHTGSMATPAQVISTAVKQTGGIQVSDTRELFDALMAFSWSKVPKSNKVAVVTNAGGPGVIATDILVENGFELSKLESSTIEEISNILPPAASAKNPIDLLGTALAQDYKTSLKIAANDPNVHSIIVIATPQLITQIEETAKVIVSLSKETPKPVIGVFLGGKYAQSGLERLHDNKIPAYSDLASAIKSLGCVYNYNKSKKLKEHNVIKKSKGKFTSEIEKYLKSDQETTLPTELSAQILEEFNIDVPRQAVAHDTADLNEFVDQVGYPVVIKAETKDIAHKTEFKALYLNIKDRRELFQNFNELTANVRKVTGKSQVGCLIQEQIIGGKEAIIGLKRDGNSNVYEDNTPGFGHVLLFGTGGIYTEIYKDFSTRLIPTSIYEIELMIKETQLFKIIDGYRGKSKLAYDKLLETLVSLHKIAQAYPQISSLDINPVFLTEDRCIAVDIKIFVKE